MKLFVWDFHGVLEKDNEKVVIIISNAVLAEKGYKERFSQEDNEKFYGLKWYQYFEKLIPTTSEKEQMALQSACFKYAEEHLDLLAEHIKPNDHAIEVLSAISKTDNDQIVISNSRQNDIEWFLKTVGVDKFFDIGKVIGVNSHQKHTSKVDALADFLTNPVFDKIIVIGDSEDDLILGKSVGATTYFYKHPHRDHENTNNADYVINDLREVLKELVL